MPDSSDIIKIGFDYRASLAQFEKETNSVFDGISEKSGKQKIIIQLDAKDDKVIEKIKELQKIKLDKFTFEFGNSGVKEQLKTFTQLEDKINDIINLSKGLTKTNFDTSNKTEAYNQLKQMADVFKNFYGNEEKMHSKAGTEAAYAYYKAYEEALKRGVAESKLQKVTIDVDPTDSFFTADKLVYDRIKQYENKLYYGETSDLTEEIASLELRLVKFSEAYSKVRNNLGEAPITPEIIKNIEEYVQYLEIAESRIKSANSIGFTKDDIDDMKNIANMYLDFAMDDAIKENEKYLSSLKDIKEEKQKLDNSITNKTDISLDTELSSNSIKEESIALEQVSENAKSAANSKEQFSKANKEVKQSANSSVDIIKEEANVLEQVSKKVDNSKLDEQKRIYKELNDSIDRYATVSKRIKKGTFFDTDKEEIEKLQKRIKELQNESILSKEQLEFSQLKLEKIDTILKDIKKNTKKNTLDSLQSEIEKFNDKYKIFSVKPTNENRSIEYQNALDKYKKSIEDLVAEKEKLSNFDVISDTELNNYIRLRDIVEENANAFKTLTAAQKGSTELSRSKEIDTISKYLTNNTKLSKEAKQRLEEYIVTLQNGGADVNVGKIHNAFLNVVKEERNAQREGKRFLDIFKNKVLYNFAGQLAAYYLSIYDFIRYAKNGINAIRELDTALVDLQKTTTMSKNSLEDFYFDSNDVAKQLGVTTKEIIEQASSWSRLGYSSQKAATDMAKISSQFASISPGMDIETSQSGLVSIMKAWDISTSDIKSVIDDINTLGNKFAETNEDIVQGMMRSAAALSAVGTSYQDAFALFTGAQEILQNAEVTGRALRTISLRIRGYSEDSEDGFEQLDDELKNITGELIELTKTAEHSEGISIFKEGSTTEFKSLVDYFGEINAIWDEMSEKQQNDFIQKAFGKTQANILCLNVQKCA